MTDAALPVMVVQASLDAYNAHDLEAFMALFSDDVRWGSAASPLVGREAVAARFRDLFTRFPHVRATLLSRMLLGPYVVDMEYVTGRDGPPVTVIAINQVVDGKIVSQTFLRVDE